MVVVLLGGGVVMVQGTCAVKDRHGENLQTSVLPYGVNYYSQLDKLECIGKHSCREWKITGCTEVECSNNYACQDAQLIDNQEVSCLAESSCLDAHFYKAHLITCGGLQEDSHNYCASAVVQTDAKLLCAGPGACVSDYEHRMTVIVVGEQGQVRCGNLQSEELSCQHMVIEIPHGRQACFQKYGGLNRGCAVLCVNDWDCDEESIQFRVS